MPSNIIQINSTEELTWVIPDSKMEEIINKLDECGDKESSLEGIVEAKLKTLVGDLKANEYGTAINSLTNLLSVLRRNK